MYKIVLISNVIIALKEEREREGGSERERTYKPKEALDPIQMYLVYLFFVLAV